jgi:hypothetical protein
MASVPEGAAKPNPILAAEAGGRGGTQDIPGCGSGWNRHPGFLAQVVV